jgi:hypothetical protein
MPFLLSHYRAKDEQKIARTLYATLLLQSPRSSLQSAPGVHINILDQLLALNPAFPSD